MKAETTTPKAEEKLYNFLMEKAFRGEFLTERENEFLITIH
jgi:hypothetical protein